VAGCAEVLEKGSSITSWSIFADDIRPLSIIHRRFRFLFALPTVRDLLLCAKHLFFAAMVTTDGR
jgi:hypothetical protein